MKLSFRQGIVKKPSGNWLQKSGDGSKISIVINNTSLLISFAHLSSNYLYEVRSSVNDAFGNGGFENSVMVGDVKQYLYIELDLSTGGVRYGYSLYDTIIASSLGNNYNNGQHWYDTNNKCMKVMRNGRWEIVVRVFIGCYNDDGNIIYNNVGSSVLENVKNDAGYLIIGNNGKPLFNGDEFLTTSSNILIANGTGQNINFESSYELFRASEVIPKFSIVRVLNNNMIALNHSYDKSNIAIGMVLEDVYTNGLVQVRSNGVVINEDWFFDDLKIGKNVFCGQNGEIKFTKPLNGISQVIGYVYDEKSIFIKIGQPVRLNQ